MSFPDTLDGQIVHIMNRLAELERRARNRKRTGKVAEVDYKKGLARVELSKQEGQPYKTDWIPWKEVAAGGIKSHIPPVVGEQVDVVSENGDMTDAIIDMSTPSTDNPRPHDGPEMVITKGGSRIFMSGGELTLTTGAGHLN